MLKVRVIPTLLWKQFGLVKGVGFDSWRRVGPVLPAIKVYNQREVDELVLLDIVGHKGADDPDYESIDEFASDCFVPFTIGGGIRRIEQVQALLRTGADKVSVNTASYENPSLVTEIARRYGVQCVVASIDVRATAPGTWHCFSRAGSHDTGRTAVEWARELEDRGAGEILLTSIERDGTMKGYDLPLVEAVARAVGIPVIASGGAGTYQHIVEAVVQAGASAVAAASMFHFTEQTPAGAKQPSPPQAFPFGPHSPLHARPSMRAVFRVDASRDIGTGHVMRCLTLANQLAAANWRTEFIGRPHDEANLAAHIEAQGHRVHALPPGATRFAAGDYASWLGCDARTDAMQTVALLGPQPPDLLVVDHYGIDQEWEVAVSPSCRSLLVIDDLANRPHRCNVLVDGNLGRSQADYRGLVAGDCTILAGGDYALLRPEFAEYRSVRTTQGAGEPPRRLLITLGGIDKDNVSGRVLESLRNAGLAQECTVTVVLGAHSPSIPAVRRIASQLPWPTEVLTNVAEMAELMSRHDFAIGAAGMTAWERCCMGLPSLVLVLAENQRAGARALRSSGAALLVEGAQDALQGPLLAGMARMLEPDTFTRMRESCLRAIDGLGLQRVLKEIGHVAA